MEPVWRQAASITPGEHAAVCLRAERHESAAGNKCVCWTFDVAGFELSHVTVVRSARTGRTALALGLRLKPLRLEDAAGRRCRLTVAKDGGFWKVTGLRPL